MSQSLLIVGQSKIKAKKEALKIAKEFSTSFDTLIFDTAESKGIEMVRELIINSFRKPFNSKLLTLIIIEADKLTSEAQNSLLKLLEEPPKETQLILTTQNRNNLLPTVVSRCLEITIGVEPFDDETADSSFTNFFSKRFSEKLEILEKSGSEEYLHFLEQTLKKTILQKQQNSSLQTKEVVNKLKTALKLNKANKNLANRKLIALLLAQN